MSRLNFIESKHIPQTGSHAPVWLAWVLLYAGIAVVFAGCGQSSPSGLHSTELSQWVGKNVRVELRRDALGVSVNQTVGQTNAVSTAIVGKLLKIHSISLLIGDERRQIWIPREVILFVEATP